MQVEDTFLKYEGMMATASIEATLLQWTTKARLLLLLLTDPSQISSVICFFDESTDKWMEASIGFLYFFTTIMNFSFVFFTDGYITYFIYTTYEINIRKLMLKRWHFCLTLLFCKKYILLYLCSSYLLVKHSCTL